MCRLKKSRRLWFDVEKRYNTTDKVLTVQPSMLWFDVEKRYNTTLAHAPSHFGSCGLM